MPMFRVASNLLVTTIALVVAAPPAVAWIHPEHRQIAGASIQGLDEGRPEALAGLWATARYGHEGRLAVARTPSQRVNATRGSDLELERVDKDYSSRRSEQRPLPPDPPRRRPVAVHS